VACYARILPFIPHGHSQRPVDAVPHNESLREVYRSRDQAACEHRAFVLRAVGIEHAIFVSEPWFVLFVPENKAHEALEHLGRYDAELSAPVPPPKPLVLHEHAWVSVLAYAFVLVILAYFAGAGTGGADWFEAGALTPSAIARGEPWRLVTALTLHADIGHLLGNLAFGGLFGYFAAQLVGAGSAWLSILLGGVLGNALDSALMLPGHTTIGASTAVFATLGMVAAYAWRQHTGAAKKWAHRWAPLIAAAALLAFTGTGGERTDVLAHLTGFASGALVGLLHALDPTRKLLARVPQWLAALVAVVLLAGAWAWALAA